MFETTNHVYTYIYIHIIVCVQGCLLNKRDIDMCPSLCLFTHKVKQIISAKITRNYSYDQHVQYTLYNACIYIYNTAYTCPAWPRHSNFTPKAKNSKPHLPNGFRAANCRAHFSPLHKSCRAWKFQVELPSCRVLLPQLHEIWPLWDRYLAAYHDLTLEWGRFIQVTSITSFRTSAQKQICQRHVCIYIYICNYISQLIYVVFFLFIHCLPCTCLSLNNAFLYHSECWIKIRRSRNFLVISCSVTKRTCGHAYVYVLYIYIYT